MQLVLETVFKRKTERVPVIPQVFGHAAFMNKVPLNDYLKDGRILAECQIRAMETYGYDAVFAMMDVNVEAEAMGAKLVYRERFYPHIQYPFLKVDDIPSGLDPPDPQSDGRMPEMLEAIHVMRRELNGKKLVTSALLGPLTTVCQLLGTETALFLLADDRDRFAEYLQFAKRLAIEYGTAQVRAGSQVPILFDPSASPVVIPPALFREFEVPMLAEVSAALMKAGASGTWLHIAGPTTKILPYFNEIGVAVVNFDYEVLPEDAIAALPNTCLDGNVKSLSFLVGQAQMGRRGMRPVAEEVRGQGRVHPIFRMRNSDGGRSGMHPGDGRCGHEAVIPFLC